jgi:CheY-like chemotaxis protein
MILIADDNSDMRRMIIGLLEGVTSEITECSDGLAAIDAYNAHLPSLVLMDINMRPLDGLSAMRSILKDHPQAKIVVISQHQDARTRETAFAMGAYAFLGKEDLMEVRELVERSVAKELCEI